MGAGASAADGAKGKDAAAIKTGVEGLSADDKAILRAALEASAGDTSIATNLKDITENEAQLHDLHIAVMSNKQWVYEARSMIESNRANIAKNYSEAFVGNRQMANYNTDDIFKNRIAILKGLKVEGAVQENFRNSKANEASIEFLEHRSLLNNRVAKVNEKMSEVNEDLILINNDIMKQNEDVVAFNASQIETNTRLLDGLQPEKATPEANATRISKNKQTIADLKERQDKYNANKDASLAVIKENRKSLEANAEIIKQRRKEILANREVIVANGAKVAALLKGRVDTVEELTAKLAGLSDEEKASMKEALSAGGDSSEASATNRKNIGENASKLHEVHLNVMTNKEKLYAIRAIIEENRALILKNYVGAFIGNRQMINSSTDDIFKNRAAILDVMKVEGQVQENFRASKQNEANVDFLDLRAFLNNRVAKVNGKMAAANTKLIEINTMVLASNEEIVKFNSQQIETNSKLLEGILPIKATAEANATRIAENDKRIQVIVDRCTKYEEKLVSMMSKVFENRVKAETNAKAVDDRRDQIIENRVKIHANGQTVVERIKAAAA